MRHRWVNLLMIGFFLAALLALSAWPGAVVAGPPAQPSDRPPIIGTETALAATALMKACDETQSSDSTSI